MNGQVGKGDRPCPVDRTKWDRGWEIWQQSERANSDPCVNCPEEEMCLYRCETKLKYVRQQ